MVNLNATANSHLDENSRYDRTKSYDLIAVRCMEWIERGCVMLFIKAANKPCDSCQGNEHVVSIGAGTEDDNYGFYLCINCRDNLVSMIDRLDDDSPMDHKSDEDV